MPLELNLFWLFNNVYHLKLVFNVRSVWNKLHKLCNKEYHNLQNKLITYSKSGYLFVPALSCDFCQ